LAFKIARNLSGFGPHPDAAHQPDRRAPKTSSPPKTRRTLSPSAGATLNTAEGKTIREIKRCLKRYIARELYRTLTATMTPTTNAPMAA
jgi:hypothetical protein